jgi:hypothetical protein
MNVLETPLSAGFIPLKPAFGRCAAAFIRLRGAFQGMNAPDIPLSAGFIPVKPAFGCCAAAFIRLRGAFQGTNAPDKSLSAGKRCLQAGFQGIISACERRHRKNGRNAHVVGSVSGQHPRSYERCAGAV